MSVIIGIISGILFIIWLLTFLAILSYPKFPAGLSTFIVLMFMMTMISIGSEGRFPLMYWFVEGIKNIFNRYLF